MQTLSFYTYNKWIRILNALQCTMHLLSAKFEKISKGKKKRNEVRHWMRKRDNEKKKLTSSRNCIYIKVIHWMKKKRKKFHYRKKTEFYFKSVRIFFLFFFFFYVDIHRDIGCTLFHLLFLYRCWYTHTIKSEKKRDEDSEKKKINMIW